MAENRPKMAKNRPLVCVFDGIVHIASGKTIGVGDKDGEKIVVKALGKPDEVRERGEHRYLVYSQRGMVFRIGKENSELNLIAIKNSFITEEGIGGGSSFSDVLRAYKDFKVILGCERESRPFDRFLIVSCSGSPFVAKLIFLDGNTLIAIVLRKLNKDKEAEK